MSESTAQFYSAGPQLVRPPAPPVPAWTRFIAMTMRLGHRSGSSCGRDLLALNGHIPNWKA
jgi:hypothetical protein